METRQDTYIDVALALYNAATQYLTESRSSVHGVDLERPPHNSSRLEAMAITSTVLAVDVMLKKPEIEHTNGKGPTQKLFRLARQLQS